MKANQVVAARGLLRWTQADLSSHSGVSPATIRRLEAMMGDLSGNATTLRSLERALEDAGVIFIPENGEGPGVRLRKERSGGASFRSFVMRAPITSDPAGDFIRDARSDRGMPDADEWQEILSYLEMTGASTQAIAAGQAAWERYRAEKGCQE